MPPPRLDLHRSTQERDALLHPMQAESRRFTQSGARVKSDAVIANHELEDRFLVLQHDCDCSRVGVPCHVGQRLLQDPVHGGLREWGQPPRNAAVHAKVDDDTKRFRKVAHVSPRGRDEPLVVQHRGMQSAGQPPDIVHRVGGHFPQPLRDRPDFGELSDVCDGTKPHQQGGEGLPGLVVQLPRDPAPLLILRGEQPLQQPQPC